MKLPRIVSLLFLAGCPGTTSPPHQLWIAANGSEAAIKLVDHQPDPF